MTGRQELAKVFASRAPQGATRSRIGRISRVQPAAEVGTTAPAGDIEPLDSAGHPNAGGSGSQDVIEVASDETGQSGRPAPGCADVVWQDCFFTEMGYQCIVKSLRRRSRRSLRRCLSLRSGAFQEFRDVAGLIPHAVIICDLFMFDVCACRDPIAGLCTP